MKNARLLFVVLAVAAAAAACSVGGPTGPLPQAPRNSAYLGGGNGTPSDTVPPADSTKKGG
ncbi:MAG TPA: hypothetical protein VF615_06525 [Longimicrobiaceae bacterium]|jgi:hypothetical protein